MCMYVGGNSKHITEECTNDRNLCLVILSYNLKIPIDNLADTVASDVNILIRTVPTGLKT